MTSKGEGDVKRSRVGVGTHPRWQFKILTSERIAKSVMYSKICFLVSRAKPAGQLVTLFESVKAC